MSEPERVTRKQRIDVCLTSPLLNWTVTPWQEGLDTSTLKAHAVEEYPTKSGPVDYALFVNGMLLGMIEAKRLSVDAENVLEQAKRYSRGVPNSVGDWRGYRVPFLYSSNGELIFHLDVRKQGHITDQLSEFHSPQGLLEIFNRDTQQAEQWFQEHPVSSIERLRLYQIEAIEAIERGLVAGKQKMLLAMATGTGKTFTIVALMYRLLKSHYARRILFLVDRRALAAQAVTTISAFETPGGLKFDQEYEVYSQRFRREDFDEHVRFDSKVLPEEYLTNPQAKHTFVYVSTIQRMTLNLFGQQGRNYDEYELDARKIDIPIHAFDVIIADECHRGYSASETGTWKRALDHFDAVKIGLTATPASHTMAMFRHKVYSYSTEQAILDGFLVDYEAVKIRSEIKINGAFLHEGELVGEIDTESGQEQLDTLEDEREFAASDIEVKITAPDSTRKILESLKKYTDQHEAEYGRFPKTLIFAVNDVPHVSHAQEVVRMCKEVFGKGDDFVQKITGKVDRPLQKIRAFRNRPQPKIVVTVDMLSTGVDVPAIEFVVFMRMVKSRILWVQMIGRGTRRCDEIYKEKFTVFDCFDGSLIEYFKDSVEFNIALQKETVPIAEVIERIYDNRDRAYHTKVLIKRLRRIEANMGAKAREEFARFIPDGDMRAFADGLPENLKQRFCDTMALLRNADFQHLLVHYPRPQKTFLKAYDVQDTVNDEIMFHVGADYQKPEDYLKTFERFVRDNPEHIEAINILLSRPAGWNTDALDELRDRLKRTLFTEKDLQRAHKYVYRKPLADIISMIKHAADFDVPLLTAEERVNRALNVILADAELNDDQEQWLAYIRQHLVENLALNAEDFDLMPVFERHGGLGKAKKIFGDDELERLIDHLNAELAA